jgi:hypothetical protein
MNPADGPSVHEVLLAHHVALLAIPAIVPAVIVVGVVLYIARKDRREERAERELLERAFERNDPDPPKEAA